MNKNSIINQNFYIDSARFIIPCKFFKKISLPKQYLIQTYDHIENSELIKEFKQKSLQLEYINTTLYINRIQSTLNNKFYDNLILLFSSKASIYPESKENKYFNGIDQRTFKEILKYLKSINFIDYNNTNDIINHCKVRDLDIKQDFLFSGNQSEIFKQLKRHFLSYQRSYKTTNDIAEGCKLYDSRQNFGLQVNHRTAKNISFKWYCKSLEIQKPENLYLFAYLGKEFKKTIENNVVIRFEFNLPTDRKIKQLFSDSMFITVLSELSDLNKISSFKNHIINNVFNRNIETDNLINLKKFKPLDRMLINMIYLYKSKLLINDSDSFNDHDRLIVAACISEFKGTEKTRQKKRIESYINFVNYQWQNQYKSKEVNFKKEIAKNEFLNIELIQIFH